MASRAAYLAGNAAREARKAKGRAKRGGPLLTPLEGLFRGLPRPPLGGGFPAHLRKFAHDIALID